MENKNTYISGMEPGDTVAVNNRFAPEIELCKSINIFN